MDYVVYVLGKEGKPLRKNLPQPPLRPAVLLAGRSSTDKRAYPALVPPAGDGRESRGTSPSGAVCGRPPAAQADKTVISSAHEYICRKEEASLFNIISKRHFGDVQTVCNTVSKLHTISACGGMADATDLGSVP